MVSSTLALAASSVVSARSATAASPLRCYHVARTSLVFQVGLATSPAHRHFSISMRPSSQPSSPTRKAVQGKDRQEGPGSKHPAGSYLLFHPIYSEQDLDSVKVVNRADRNLGDRVARSMVTIARTIFDIATRYPDHRGKKFPPIKQQDIEKTVELPSNISRQVQEYKKSQHSASASSSPSTPTVINKTGADLAQLSQQEGAMTLQDMRAKGLCFGPDGWLNRIIFLESIAGVPGMVGATCRHLQSLRLMRRDSGWIHTLLEEAENERMHLLTFMELAKPGWIARTFALLAQGVFYNFFFVFYLLAPRVAHRFVGVLEEEAVLTYSSILEDLKEGRLPEWENVAAPEIAKHYWQLGEGAMLEDVIRAVRADEASHRHVNHTFASLEANDPNPFAYREPPAKMLAEEYGLERDEALAWAEGEKQQGADSDASPQTSPKRAAEKIA